MKNILEQSKQVKNNLEWCGYREHILEHCEWEENIVEQCECGAQPRTFWTVGEQCQQTLDILEHILEQFQ